MSSFVLIHGGGGTAAFWDGVAAELTRLGHKSVAVDLPCDDPEAGWDDYTNAVIEAAAGISNPIVVAHSAGGFVAPLVVEALGARDIVLLAAMIPAPGETFMEWWENTGFGEYAGDLTDDTAVYYNDVPPELAEEDMKRGEGRENFPSGEWPMDSWPDVPTRYVLFRDDKLFPPEFLKKVVGERLGILPGDIEELEGGHCAILSRPDEIAAKLDEIWKMK